MLIGYARVSKTDGSQVAGPLQRDALGTAGVDAVNVYHDLASGVRDDRPGLDSCLRAPDTTTAVERGRIEVRFDGAKDAMQRLDALAHALGPEAKGARRSAHATLRLRAAA